MRPSRYNPNSPFYVDRAIVKAEKRLEEMKLRREIYNVDRQLKRITEILALSSPPKAST